MVFWTRWWRRSYRVSGRHMLTAEYFRRIVRPALLKFRIVIVRSDPFCKKCASDQMLFGKDEEITFMARCKFCGQGHRAGQPCAVSPTGYHVVYEPNRCIYCGGCGRAGGPCACSPHGSHVVDAGPSRSIYCGGYVCNAVGATQCSCSPTGHCFTGGGPIFA